MTFNFTVKLSDKIEEKVWQKTSLLNLLNSYREALTISKSNNIINIISDYILDCNSFASTPLQYEDKIDFYWYNGGYYEHNGEEQIYQQIKTHFPKVRLSDREISKIITRIQDLSIVTDSFDSDSNLTNYLNGVYNHTDNKLYPHSPRYYFTHQVNQNYVENAPSSLSKLAARLAMIG